jgi:hypothetical protein
MESRFRLMESSCIVSQAAATSQKGKEICSRVNVTTKSLVDQSSLLEEGAAMTKVMKESAEDG